MPNHRKSATPAQRVANGICIVLGVASIGLSAAHALLPVHHADQPAATTPSISPRELPEVITGHAYPAARMVEPEVVTPAAPVLTESVKPAPVKASTPTVPKTKTATAPTPPKTVTGGTGARPPARSSIPVGPDLELYCTNGYQHADGTCSSTPEYPTFSQPNPNAPCSGTASACLDAISGITNPIAGLLGSGS
jgi:hypothetical protein